MDIQSQVLNAVLKNYGMKNKNLYSSIEGVSTEEFENELKRLEIFQHKSRDKFVMTLENLTETMLFENREKSESNVFPDLIAEAWNKSNNLPITSDIAITALQTTNLNFPNARKAFLYLCEGELQDYKVFNNKPKMFVELLLKLLISISSKKQMHTIKQEVEEVMPLLFDNIDTSEVAAIIKRTDLTFKMGPSYPKMVTFKKEVGLDNLVFANGIKAILADALNERDVSGALITLKEKLEDLKDGNAPKEVSLNQIDVPIESETQNTENVEVFPETEASATDEMTLQEQPEATANGEDVLTSLETALLSVQTAIKQVTPLLEDHDSKSTLEPSYKLAIAEEEINRLNVALEQEKEKAEKMEEAIYTKLFKAIGGESSDYLLSDLMVESQGERPEKVQLSQWRLESLFDKLEFEIGLEKHSNNHELGEVFTVSKTDLIKDYHIDSPVESQDSMIQVKLMKYGWTLNGKIIIRPLIIELKGEL
ncbi:hypothetical protein [Exiguobacterium chiriqhucha]|uniref:Uncharacterized protein n=1 Tax=Exiguobacterium chiriqhucha RW-2 TaxID=1345023 RepID=U1N253_9BACL|nr:hypothetical protein [Exiguobacterium chiriqhucha]ERG68051.1 hypothetical protein M467_12245 [Exiguobacterium chiriqhucha RW-2]